MISKISPILFSFAADRLFRCRFNTSKSVRRQSAGNKLVLIRACCLPPPSASSAAGSYWTSNPVWVCFCSPLEPHPTRSSPESPSTPPLADTNLFLACFHSQHGRDMRLQAAQDRWAHSHNIISSTCSYELLNGRACVITKRVNYYPANTSPPTLPCSVSAYLGFDVTALSSCSWYSLLHPQDLSHASAQHRSLCKCTHTYLHTMLQPWMPTHLHTLCPPAHPHNEKTLWWLIGLQNDANLCCDCSRQWEKEARAELRWWCVCKLKTSRGFGSTWCSSCSPEKSPSAATITSSGTHQLY